MKMSILGAIIMFMLMFAGASFGDNPTPESTNVDQLFEQALDAEDSGQFEKARILYTNIVDSGATHIKTFLNLALSYKHEGNLTLSADILLEGIRRNESAQTEGASITKLYNNLGEVYRAQKQYDKAISEFNKALSLDPQMIGPNMNIGLCYDIGMNHSDKAIPYYQREVEIAPNTVSTFDAYLNLGIYAQEIQKDYEASIKYFNKAIEIGPMHPDLFLAYNSRAATYYLKGNYQLAKQDWQKVVELASNTDVGRNAAHNLRAVQ
jgi:tetratricopeptide (TPR) repeat protein